MNRGSTGAQSPFAEGGVDCKIEGRRRFRDGKTAKGNPVGREARPRKGGPRRLRGRRRSLDSVRASCLACGPLMGTQRWEQPFRDSMTSMRGERGCTPLGKSILPLASPSKARGNSV